MDYELIIGLFPNDPDKAIEQLDRYHASQDEIGIADAVAIIKTQEGKDKVKWLGGKKKATEIGAIAGAALGILGGPPTMIVLGLAGAGAGNLIASLSHAGISKKLINAIEEGIEPGSSAVVVIVEHAAGHLLIKDLEEQGATIHNDTVESHEIEGKYFISLSSGISEA